VYIRIVYYRYFEWDEAKSDENLAAREFDFAFATLIFQAPTLDRAAPDGTTRRRIISARRSNDREREDWRESTGG
jgi:uncharacterized DUF497 family protein